MKLNESSVSLAVGLYSINSNYGNSLNFEKQTPIFRKDKLRYSQKPTSILNPEKQSPICPLRAFIASVGSVGSEYRRLNEDITVDIQKRVTVFVKRMYTDDLIDEKTKQYLIQPDVKPGRFYILPKVHKPSNPGRPILSSNSHPTERISHFIDHHLQPNYHLMLKTLTIFSINSLLVTLDVSSLYTNIPHNEGINACDHFLCTDPHNTIPTGTICDLIRMILTINNFTFNDSHYLQIHGTAMGKRKKKDVLRGFKEDIQG